MDFYLHKHSKDNKDTVLTVQLRFTAKQESS